MGGKLGSSDIPFFQLEDERGEIPQGSPSEKTCQTGRDGTGWGEKRKGVQGARVKDCPAAVPLKLH